MTNHLIESPLRLWAHYSIDFGEHRVKHTVPLLSSSPSFQLQSADAPTGPDNDTLDISLPFSNIFFNNINLNSRNEHEVLITNRYMSSHYWFLYCTSVGSYVVQYQIEENRSFHIESTCFFSYFINIYIKYGLRMFVIAPQM